MIKRIQSDYIMKTAGFYPVVTVTGPRQSGKTTLVKSLFPDHEYCNLEAEDVLAQARHDPRSFLGKGDKRIILDEVQRFPGLLTYVQEYADSNRRMGQFVLTGSHQPELNAAIAESLAGRTGICELLPLSIRELVEDGRDNLSRDRLIVDGFMPRLYDSGIEPTMLYRDYFQTYVQRDVRKLVNVQDLDAFTTFVHLLAGRVGQLLNRESLARDVGVAVPTIGRWLSVLEASFVIYRLKPYHNNFGKRQTKASKVYFTETGLVSYLLGIRSPEQVYSHPLVGSLFENMVVMEALKSRMNRGLDPDMYFYRNSSGTIEVDLLFEDGGRLYPREIKSSATYDAKMSRGLREFCSLSDQATDPLVVYSGAPREGIVASFSDPSAWCV